MINFKIEQFEGPLSLLLKLIEQEEMDITRVSMAGVADQYVAYIRQKDVINPDEVADFLVVAAKLLLIKSKALLPYIYPEKEEDIDELEKQLKMYKEFVEASKRINLMIGKKKFMFAREFNRKVLLSNLSSGSGENLFAPPKKLIISDLRMVFSDLIARLMPVEKLEEQTLDKKINIEDKILSIQQMLATRIKMSFNKILKSAKDKTEIIVSFLAVLELMHQKEVVLVQEEMFGEIIITHNA